MTAAYGVRAGTYGTFGAFGAVNWDKKCGTARARHAMWETRAGYKFPRSTLYPRAKEMEAKWREKKQYRCGMADRARQGLSVPETMVSEPYIDVPEQPGLVQQWWPLAAVGLAVLTVGGAFAFVLGR